MTTLRLDASQFRQLSADFRRLPEQMQKQVLGRALGRSKKKVQRTYAQLASIRMAIAQKHITKRMRTTVTDGEMTVRVTSEQIPLNEMNPSQRGYGVFVKGRKRYMGAFIVNQGASRAAGLVLRRAGPARLPTTMLFGPNPAGEIERNRDPYQEMLADVFDTEFVRQIAENTASLLRRMGQ